MSVSVHCMRLAASYDTLTEDKLRYRLAQSHTHPIRSVWVIYRTHLYYLALNRVLTCLHDSIQKITLFGGKINAEIIWQTLSLFANRANHSFSLLSQIIFLSRTVWLVWLTHHYQALLH